MPKIDKTPLVVPFRSMENGLYGCEIWNYSETYRYHYIAPVHNNYGAAMAAGQNWRHVNRAIWQKDNADEDRMLENRRRG